MVDRGRRRARGPPRRARLRLRQVQPVPPRLGALRRRLAQRQSRRRLLRDVHADVHRARALPARRSSCGAWPPSAACVLLAGGALFTYSRQSYFLVLLSVALLLAAQEHHPRRRSSASTLVSLAGYLPDASPSASRRPSSRATTATRRSTSSTASRWEIWAGAMGMLREQPARRRASTASRTRSATTRSVQALRRAQLLRADARRDAGRRA